MLWTRVVSAIIPLPVVIALILYAPTWGWAIFVGVVVGIAFDEYLRITRAAGGALERWTLAAVAVAASFGFHFASAYFVEMVVGLVLFSLIWVLFSPREIATAFPRAAALVTGFFYVPLLLGLLNPLHALPNGDRWLFVSFFVAWAGDTGAYFAGRAFGRHKLYPQVSPKKTWEGAIGGLLGSFGGVVLAKYWFMGGLGWLDCALIALPGGALGQIGDLCESLMKRSYDVKDSGSIMPGHGGILDRADALMFVMPYVYVYATRFFPLG